MTVITLTKNPSGGVTATGDSVAVWSTGVSGYDIARHILFFPEWTRRYEVPPPLYMLYATWGGRLWTRSSKPPEAGDHDAITALIDVACAHAEHVLNSPNPTMADMCQSVMGGQPPLGIRSPAANIQHAWFTPERVKAVREFRPHPYGNDGYNGTVSQYADMVIEAATWGMVQTELAAKEVGVSAKRLERLYYWLAQALDTVFRYEKGSVQVGLVSLRKATIKGKFTNMEFTV